MPVTTIMGVEVGGADLDSIKGDNYAESTDSLHQIASKTNLVRADTGELNGSAILDLYVTNNLTLTGNITVDNLYVLDGAVLDGQYDILQCFHGQSLMDQIKYLKL